jgi:hypothetical protein
MSDFDDLLADAENFQEEEDFSGYDDFAADSSENQSKKRTLVVAKDATNLDRDNPVEKRIKTNGCLADYFIDSDKPATDTGNRATTSVTENNNYSQKGGNSHNYSQNAPKLGRERTVVNNNSIVVEEKGPMCMCGISSISKTTLKEGPNKNRKFWVRYLQLIRIIHYCPLPFSIDMY